MSPRPSAVDWPAIDRALICFATRATDAVIEFVCLLVFCAGLAVGTAVEILDHATDGLSPAISADISPALLPLPIVLSR